MADLKTPLAFVGGLLAGAAGTWVVSAKYFNNKIDTEIAKIREEFDIATQGFKNESEMLNVELEDANREIAKMQSVIAGYSSISEDETVPEKPKKATKKSKSMEELEKKPEPEDIVAGKVDYTSYSKSGAKKEDPEVEVKPAAKKSKTPQPYIIDKNDFAADDDREKVLLTYFSNDNLFVDANGDICGGNIASQIGKNNINFLVRESVDNIIYVRNDENMVDYKVILDEDPFENYEEDEAEEED